MHPGKDEIQEHAHAFQRGEEKGFNYFFDKLFSALLFYAFRILKNKQDAEDVVGESFIKIWKRHRQFNHPAVIKSWLYTTVYHGCLNRLKQEKRREERKEELASLSEGIHESSPVHEIIRAEVIRELHAGIQSLPAACRQIFEKLYIEGKTVREIAEELKLAISTVKNQKARGLLLLRRKFPGIPVLLLLAAWTADRVVSL